MTFEVSSGTVTAAEISFLPSLHVLTTDAYGNRRLRLEDVEYEVRCSSLLPVVQLAGNVEVVDFVEPTQLVRPMMEGIASFPAIPIRKPTAGALTIYCFATFDLTLNITVHLTVVAGAPSAIAIQGQPTWLAGVMEPRRLQPSPKVWVVDSAGNFVKGTEEYARVIFSSATEHSATATTSQFAKVSSDGTYAFENVLIRTVFDEPATLNIAIGDVPRLTYTVPQELCVVGIEYAVAGTFECRTCPPHGICDGTSSVAVEPGYWRAHRQSLEFYDCPADVDACPGGTTCNRGYRGTRCGACEEGYGRTGSACSTCFSPGLSWTVIVVLFLVFIGVVFYLSIYTMTITCSTEAELFALQKTERNPFAIVMKIGISHFQLISMIPFGSLTVPSWMRSFVSGSSRAKMEPNLSFIACELASNDFTMLQVVLLLIPLGFGVFVLISFLAAWRRTATSKNTTREKASLYRKNAIAGIATCAEERKNVAHTVAKTKDHYHSIVRSHNELFGEANAVTARPTHTGNSAGTTPPFSTALHLRSVNASVASTPLIPVDMCSGLRSLSLQDKISSSSQPGGGGDASVGCNEITTDAYEDGSAPPLHLRVDFRERFINMAALALVVMVFILYPTIVDSCAGLLQCQEIDYGPTKPPQKVVERDPSIDCNSSEYTAALALAWGALIGIGLGGPLMCAGIILLLRNITCRGDLSTAKTVFFFTTGGYRESLWFWECVSLARKFVLVLAVTIAPEDPQRLLFGTWVLIASFLLNIVMHPWSDRPLSIAEAASLGTSALTFGLCHMLFNPTVANNNVVITLVYIAMAIFNLIALMFLVSAMLWSIRKTIVAMTLSGGFAGQVAKALLEWIDDDSSSLTHETVNRVVKDRRDQLYRMHPRTAAMSEVEFSATRSIQQAEEALQLAEVARTNVVSSSSPLLAPRRSRSVWHSDNPVREQQRLPPLRSFMDVLLNAAIENDDALARRGNDVPPIKKSRRASSLTWSRRASSFQQSTSFSTVAPNDPLSNIRSPPLDTAFARQSAWATRVAERRGDDSAVTLKDGADEVVHPFMCTPLSQPHESEARSTSPASAVALRDIDDQDQMGAAAPPPQNMMRILNRTISITTADRGNNGCASTDESSATSSSRAPMTMPGRTTSTHTTLNPLVSSKRSSSIRATGDISFCLQSHSQTFSKRRQTIEMGHDVEPSSLHVMDARGVRESSNTLRLALQQVQSALASFQTLQAYGAMRLRSAATRIGFNPDEQSTHERVMGELYLSELELAHAVHRLQYVLMRQAPCVHEI